MWHELKDYRAEKQDTAISDLFEQSGRAKDFSVSHDGMLFDYSKTTIDAGARALLIGLLEKSGVAEKRAAMFGGAVINETEGRAVLHTVLRNLDGDAVMVDGADVTGPVRATLARMGRFADEVRSGAFAGQGGKITDIINIGIGGSDLGPAMATLALAPAHDGPRCHFVSNVDPADIAGVLRICDPETTLVIVASKTFTTIETMTNAATARAWMQAKVADPGAQFAALSSAEEKTAQFGIAAERVFGFEDWVGGRYSLWGPIGLSLMLAVGPENFAAFLRGAQAMDRHFCEADWADNIPAMLALSGIWHNQVCGYTTRAVLPYDNLLARLPAYLQQLEMESNGKRVAMDGSDLAVDSGPVVWGEPGTNGQHAFYQLIHQGTRIVPCEFLVAARGHEDALHGQHQLLIANCLAQSEALMRGRSFAEAQAIMAARGLTGDERDRQAKHRVFPGNRPSTTLAYAQLTPYVLGQIIALYEHRVFVEGVVLGINSYDQWGVELGKELATALGPMVTGAEGTRGKDGSTAGLINFLQAKGT
ncbi:MAG: glucose-6-phosphate isomerase [Rhodobacteraceae bacterium]|nr:glucose-6-phosphate isomerase [Paracoccaceae bacterium]